MQTLGSYNPKIIFTKDLVYNSFIKAELIPTPLFQNCFGIATLYLSEG